MKRLLASLLMLVCFVMASKSFAQDRPLSANWNSTDYSDRILKHISNRAGPSGRLHTCDKRFPTIRDSIAEVLLDLSGCVHKIDLQQNSGIPFRDAWFVHSIWLGAPYEVLAVVGCE